MSTAPAPDSPLPTVAVRADPVNTYARVTGVLMLLSMVFGYLGEMQIPSHFIVSTNAAETARRIAAEPTLFRFGFAAYLVEALCDVGLAVMFYVLLEPVSRTLALGAAFFGLIATATYAFGELFYFLPTIWANDASFLTGFSREQIEGLTLLCMKIFGRAGWGFLAFYGVATFLRGYLIYRSAFLPKTIGAVLMAGGLGFVAKNVTYVLAPSYSSDALLAPLALGGLLLMVWLLVKGVEVTHFRGGH
jgi:hypothetical protein